MFQHPFAKQDHAIFKMGNGRGAVALRFGGHFLRGQLDGFPVVELAAKPDHLFLAGVAMPAILLVRFLEFAQRCGVLALAHQLHGGVVSLQGLRIGGLGVAALRANGRKNTSHSQDDQRKAHKNPPKGNAAQHGAPRSRKNRIPSSASHWHKSVTRPCTAG